MHLLLEGFFMHLAITGDALWCVSRDPKGKPLEIWPMHPVLTKIVATRQGDILGYVMKAPGEEPVGFSPMKSCTSLPSTRTATSMARAQ